MTTKNTQPPQAPEPPQQNPEQGPQMPPSAAPQQPPMGWQVVIKMDDGEVFQAPPMTEEQAQNIVNSLRRDTGKVMLNFGPQVEVFNAKNVARVTAALVQLQEQPQPPAPAENPERRTKKSKK